MKRLDMRPMLAAAAILSALACSSPAAAQEEGGGYKIVGAGQAKRTYPYLTVDSVAAKLRPAIAAQLPAAPDRRLVILNVNLLALRNADKMVRLRPADLQVQWNAAGVPGAAPILGAHISKDYMPMGSEGFYTSMRPDTYELFAIVPQSVQAVDLAQRQPDGSFKPVKKIAIAPPRR